jgi:hypothetical protein
VLSDGAEITQTILQEVMDEAEQMLQRKNKKRRGKEDHEHKKQGQAAKCIGWCL